MLGADEVAGFLNGYSVLWHPAALRGASGPPKIGSPYDHEQPSAGQVFAVPESPPLILPEDWERRVKEAGAVHFRATPDRAATLANLLEALRSLGGDLSASGELLALDPTRVAPFLGIGFGHRTIETLFEAMEHEQVLSVTDFWLDVQQAIGALNDPDPDASRRHLQAAADRLLAAREVVYPVSINLIDLCLLGEARPAEPPPASLDKGFALNIVVSAARLEQLGRDSSEEFARLRERVHADLVEICGGPYRECEDAVLPVESQLWNLVKGQTAYKSLLDREMQVFARRRFAFHPQLPLFLHAVGLHRAVLLSFDESVVPTYRVSVINWPSPDGKQIEAFTRAPYAADNAQTFFHWAHYLHKTIAQDHSATLALIHSGKRAAPWYDDLLELCRFGPVLGQWTTLSRYLNDVLAGEYASALSADEFHGDYLSERTNQHGEHPVSWFARHVRWRRRLDAAWTMSALSRGLHGRADPLAVEAQLSELEEALETKGAIADADLETLEHRSMEAVASRLLSRAAEAPGFLVLNPCSFARRVALELEGISEPLALAGPLKACQLDGNMARLVVEVPALGFAWIPRRDTPGTAAAPARMRSADQNAVRNEFLEAEIDPETGGLRALRDHRTRINRLGQQLVFNPGSSMRARSVKVLSSGPALGEVLTEGDILDEQNRVLARFRQRFRAWMGRPVLDLRIEIIPQHQPQGYAWHAYYGARFAWRDDRAALLRGVNGTGYVTTHTRPETPEFLEVRSGKLSTVLFPCGLPFHQRHGSRMVDVILIPEGETCQSFDMALALDRDYPAQTALGLVTPVNVLATTKGPPHIGASGWLFHLNAPNVLLTSFRPAADRSDAVVARMLECSSHGGQNELRCVRDPKRAMLLDARGSVLHEVTTTGDAALFEIGANDLVHLRVEFD
jgi:hypothetical protein